MASGTATPTFPPGLAIEEGLKRIAARMDEVIQMDLSHAEDARKAFGWMAESLRQLVGQVIAQG